MQSGTRIENTGDITISDELKIYAPDPAVAAQARVSGMAAYEALCKEAETDYEGFWAKRARELITWKTPFTKVLDESEEIGRAHV